MSILPYSRLDGIIDHLIVYDRDPIPLKHLSHIFTVSERTLRNDIISINEDISQKGVAIKLFRGKGYKLIKTVENPSFYTWWVESKKRHGKKKLQTPEDRQTYLLLYLLTATEPLSLDDLLNQLFITKNTFYSYLKNAKELLAPFQVKIMNRANIGFILVGSEFNKRQAIIELLFRKDLEKYVLSFSETEYQVLNSIDLTRLKKMEMDILKPLDLFESDYYHKNILSALALTIIRIQNKMCIEEMPIKVPTPKKEAQVVFDTLLEKVEKEFSLSFDDLERIYVYHHLMVNFPRLADISHQSEEVLSISKNIVHKFLDEIKKTTLYDWTNDLTLKKDLIAHIKNFVGLELYNQNRINPLLETIRKSFPLAHDLSLTHLNKLANEYGIYFSEDEIGYIALHLAGAIERNELSRYSQVNAILVCSSGLTMSKLIELKIKKKYPDLINIIKNQSYLQIQNELLDDVDLIISTVPLNHKDIDIPVFVLDVANIDNCLAKLNSFIPLHKENNNYLSQLLFPHHFHLFTEETSKAEVLQTMVTKLIEEKAVDSTFLESVYLRESIAPTIIDTNIAIPHPMELLADKSVISVAIIPSGVLWDSQSNPIQFVFLFAIAKSEYESTKQFYDLLINFMENKEAQNTILATPNFSNFFNVLQLI